MSECDGNYQNMAILLDLIEMLNFYKKIIFFIYDRIVRIFRRKLGVNFISENLNYVE